MPNIFKMTPDMMSALSSSTNEETPLGILDESPPSNALSQSQVNVNTANQPPSSNDPFSISKNRINGDVRNNAGSLALFEKFNSKKNNVAPIDPIIRPDPHIFDTPTGPAGSTEDSIFSGKEIRGRAAAAPISTEPPLAPPKKERTLPGLGMDFSIDAPPKMRSKSRSKGDSGDQDNSTISRSSTTSNGAGDLKRTVSGKAPQATAASSRLEADTSNDPGAPQRRSQRLFNHMRTQSGRFAASTSSIGAKESRELKKAKATGTKGRTANTFNVGRVVSGNRKHGDPMDVDSKEQRPVAHSGLHAAAHKPMVNERMKELEGLQQLLDLFMKLGSGYFALSHYQCQDALRCFNSISPGQRDTPWVLAQIGRAYYEQSSYLEAEKTFTRIKSMAPSRLEGMELYSTSLWHLKSDIDLAFLAHELIDIDRNSPQAWCAVGNSFSLQRDHDQALKCFKRATQLDPKFAYAFTLQGHEHVANEEYDKALSAYRSSIAAENRHYNAWYGLGRVFEKQGKYAFAEQHFRTAASINPTNAVLVCCIGEVLEKLKNPKAALIHYSRACELSEKSTLWRFKKARVLMTLHEPERALVELRVLEDTAPDEANVHFELGRAYKQLRQKGSAIRHFTMALNLDPKVSLVRPRGRGGRRSLTRVQASQFIKGAMEQMEDDEDDEDM